jgi:hypothetical protein
MKETRVESTLRVEVKKRGGWAIKFLPSVSGLPDRIILMPGGRIYFVETKSPTGTVAPHQTVVHNRLRALGFEVHVISTPESARAWVNNIT